MEFKIYSKIVNIIRKQTQQIQRTNSWLTVGRGIGEEQDRGRQLTGTNYYVLILKK